MPSKIMILKIMLFMALVAPGAPSLAQTREAPTNRMLSAADIPEVLYHWTDDAGLKWLASEANEHPKKLPLKSLA